MKKKNPEFYRPGSLSEEVNNRLRGIGKGHKPEEANSFEIASTTSPEKAEAVLAPHFGSIIISDPEGKPENNMLLIVHGEDEPPTEDSLIDFGKSLLKNAARRRVKKFMVIAGPYCPEPKKHRSAIPYLYKGVSEMMERKTVDEPQFKGIIVPTSENYEQIARSSGMLFNINAKRVALSHKVRQALKTSENKFTNEASFKCSKPMTADDQSTALEQALSELDLNDLAMLIRVKRYYNRIIKRSPSMSTTAYLHEHDLDEII